MKRDLKQQVLSILTQTPKIDIHTHLSADRLMARGLDDILLYHMVNSELYSAGCPYGARVAEDRSEAQAEERIAAAVPYLPRIRNTSLYHAVVVILRDLYGWDQEISSDNWKKLHERIKESNRDDNERCRTILDKLNIRKTGTELCRRIDGRADDLFQYAIESAFFARQQWGQPDIPLFELERAWSSEMPLPPLPVTMKIQDRPVLAKRIGKVEDIDEAVSHYCRSILKNDINATAQHLSTDIEYRRYSESEVAGAIRDRDSAGPRELSIYASAILHAFFREFERTCGRIVFQFSLGAEALPHETGARLSQNTIGELADMIASYPNIRFMCFNASRHAHQSLCTLVRELPNLTLGGFWWHSFFPGALRQMAEERLDMLPQSKQCDYMTDAYCLDWVYGKNRIILDQFARVFADKVECGQYTLPDVEKIARGIFFEAPVALLSFRGK
jgi:hypothetical protein